MMSNPSVIASEAKQSSCAPVGAQENAEVTAIAALLVGALRAQLDCFVASLLAMTPGLKQPHVHSTFDETTKNKENAMNIHSKPSRPEITTGPLPASRKIFVTPEAAPDLRVPLREIMLSEGAGEPNLSGLRHLGPLHRQQRRDRREQGPSAHAPAVGARARRRRGV